MWCMMTDGWNLISILYRLRERERERERERDRERDCLVCECDRLNGWWWQYTVWETIL